MSEKDELQRELYRFITTWFDGLNLTIEGKEIGECLEYQMTQVLCQRVIELLSS